MKKLLCSLIVGLMLLPGMATGEDWTREHTMKEIAYGVVHTIDWGQTLYIADHDEFIETNPVLGEYPSRGNVNTYFAATMLAHGIISYMLPVRYAGTNIFIPEHPRDFWQNITFVAQAGVVGYNFGMGVKIGF